MKVGQIGRWCSFACLILTILVHSVAVEPVNLQHYILAKGDETDGAFSSDIDRPNTSASSDCRKLTFASYTEHRQPAAHSLSYVLPVAHACTAWI